MSSQDDDLYEMQIALITILTIFFHFGIFAFIFYLTLLIDKLSIKYFFPNSNYEDNQITV